MALERNHARAHEAVLQFGDRAGLLLQEVLRVARKGFEQALDARHVVRGFGERARELLDRGVAVELERIEVAAVSRADIVFVTMEDLRFGFDLELAELFLQARDGARQLAEVELDRAHLLLEARARDADFTGVVEQRVEQLRVDARHLGAIRRRSDGLAARRHGKRRRPMVFVAVALGAFRRREDGACRDGSRSAAFDEGHYRVVGARRKAATSAASHSRGVRMTASRATRRPSVPGCRRRPAPELVEWHLRRFRGHRDGRVGAVAIAERAACVSTVGVVV